MTIPPFNTYLGTEVAVLADGKATVTLDLAPHHLNRRGVAHGGVVTTLLDSALGAAVISSIPKEWWCATTSLNTYFLDGAGSGRLTASGRLIRRGRSVAFAEGEIRDEADRVIATASGTWHLWNHRPGRRVSHSPGAVTLSGGGRELHVGKILAVGRNYSAHIAEMGAPEDSAPVFFLKPPSALVAGGGTIRLPPDAGEVHHEVELVVVVGRSGKMIPASEAPDHILGFAVGLDLTLRDVQNRAKQRGEPWTLSKGFDGSAPVSEVAMRDDVGDGSGLEIRLEVNGEVRQQGNTSQLLTPVAELIAIASRSMTLERGDLIFTGTPAGVGALRPGDRVQASVERVGSLQVRIAEGG
jgi:uncharacterized protein (TIGR00369 family)